MEKSELIERVQSAFSNERIDGQAAFSQWGQTYLDAHEYAEAVEGKTWEQLDREYIVRRHDALGFLSTRELAQLLPIYLRSVIEDGVMSPALDSVLVALTRSERETARQRFDAFVAALSLPQRDAVKAVLSYVAEQDPDGSPGHAARVALEKAWK